MSTVMELPGPYCGVCKSSLAMIFQVDGDFCAECWQAVTHPNVEHRL